jgi:predicted Zn-dependent peptidase
MSQILGSGQSSRLYQRLVKEQEMATSASAFAAEQRGPGLEQFAVMARPGKDLAAIEKAVYEEIAKIQKEPVTDEELEKVRMQARRSQVASAQSTLNRAALMADDFVDFGDANLVNERYRKTTAVTIQDIMRVAKKYLTENNRTVIVTLPKKAAPAAPGQ